MNAKWCISILLVIFALLGLSQPHKKVSNQQISLQFGDVEVASENAREEVLSNITNKLLFLGVEGIEVYEDVTGQVNIRYYSDIDANVVKEFLSEEDSMSLEHGEELPSKSPKEPIQDNYSLVVSDLHQQGPQGLKISGDVVSNQQEICSGFFNTLAINPTNTFHLRLVFDQTAFKTYHTIAMAIDNTSRNIPEGRAGPFLHGIG
ncbi:MULTISPECIES: hypothetical protein [Maribacter]|uniref:Uncharacterized protein n=1 Tax=Maribacter flavus TaxID=1658664 RepID=A0ABU7IHJ8_9FLAO|nr:MULTISPECIES: hypothetical protein [Maribacter]MDC6404976.1 hypothetical protein [Maribacter sp. PR66]MEE1972390.1 hypothetical protein [Maribacter flavus]